MIQEGKPAPAFALEHAGGEKIKLSDFRGRPAVTYFYPEDDAPGRLAKSGAVVPGVSPDGPEVHQRFQDRYKLKFTLLSDPDKAVAAKYGTWAEMVMYGKRVTSMIRSTFVIHARGVVRRVFPRVRVDGHAEQVLAALAALG